MNSTAATLSPAGRRKLRRLAVQSHTTHAELWSLSERYRAVIGERGKLRSKLPEAEAEAERAAAEASRSPGNKDYPALERWRDESRRLLDDQRTRLEDIETELADLSNEQARLERLRAPLSNFVDRVIDGCGYRADDVRAELEGRNR